MGWNKAKLLAFSNRRAERMSQQGRLLEDEVECLLTQLKKQGDILDFIRHPANSQEDFDGKDFSVTAKMDENEIARHSFGVTISLKRWGYAKVKHPDVPQFCWPIGTSKETIKKRILELFKPRS